MTKIYESPDGGKTVYERESGETDRTLVIECDADDVCDVTEASTLSVSASSITGSSITGSTYAYNGYPYHSGNITIESNSNSSTDITFTDETGKEYSFKQMYKSLEAIEKRLTILVPDDKLLKKYEILQDLYDQYKAAEALLYDNEDE